MSEQPAKRATHPSLADAFRPTGRGAALAGVLPPRADRDAESAPPAPAITATPDSHGASSDVAAVPQPTTKTTAVRRTARPSTAKPAEARLVNLPVYLPPDLLELVQAAAGRSRTYADVLFDAFEVVTDDELTRAFRPIVATPSPGGVPRRPVARSAEPGIQRQFRVTPEQLAWVGEKETRVNATSRSALCVQVLRLGLPRITSGG